MQIVKSESGAVASALPAENEGKTLVELFDVAQNGMRRVIALGIYAHEIKARLKRGEFGPWLKAFAPKLCRLDEEGTPKPSASLSSYMQLTSGVLETCGIKHKELADPSYSQRLGITHRGELLTMPEDKVPEEGRALRDQMCSLIDGKTQRQLFLEFKTADDDVKVKKGGGAPIIKFHCQHCAPGAVVLRGKLGSKVECPLCKKTNIAKPDPRSAAEIQEELKLTARDEVQSLAGAIRSFVDATDGEEPQDWALFVTKGPNGDWQALLDLGTELTAAARKRLGKKKPHAKGTKDAKKGVRK